MTLNDKAARRSRLLITAGTGLAFALGTPAMAQTAPHPRHSSLFRPLSDPRTRLRPTR